MGKEAVIYIRVSTTMQVKDGVSLGMQEDACKKWCEYNRYEVKGVFRDEGITGKKLEGRTGLAQAIEACERNDMFVIYSFTRLSRKMRDTLNLIETLKEKKVDVFSVKENIDTGDKMGTLYMQIMGMMSEFEGNMIVERIKDGMNKKKQLGELCGKPPYGYVSPGKGKDLVPSEEELKNIEIMKQKRNEKNRFGRLTSYEEIAKHLNSLNIKTRSGSVWYPKTVNRILNRGEVITKGRSSYEDKYDKKADPNSNFNYKLNHDTVDSDNE